MFAKLGSRALAVFRPPRLAWPLRYTAAVLSVLLTFSVQHWGFPEPNIAPFAFLFAGIALASWLSGGSGPTALATLLAAGLGNAFFIEPSGQLKLSGLPFLVTALFMLGGMVIALFSGALWRALEEAGRKADLLRRALEERKRVAGEKRWLAEALCLERDWLIAAINGIQEYVLFLDESGQVTLANEAFRRAFGVCRDHDLLVPVRALLEKVEIFTPEGRRRAVEESPLLAALAGETTTGSELVRHPKTRELRYLQYTAAPVRSGGRMVGAVAVARDVTDQRKAEEAERESEERFRIMADSAPIPIWVTDGEGTLLFVNRTTCEYFGVTQEDIQEGRWRTLLHPEDAPGYLAASAVAIREHAPFRAEARFRRADGEWRWMASRAAPRFSPRGEYLGHVGASPDITDRKQAEAALREAERQRSEFLAMLSHELRNPLAPIRNGVTLLARGASLDERSRRALAIVERQVNQLARLVDDLLDVTRFTRGKIQLHRARLDLVEVVRRAVEDHRTILGDHRVALELSREPIWVDADGARMAQVVGNLLSNASKFTPAGGRIAVRAARSGDEGVVEVADTGMGMDPQTIDRLFQPFVQAERSLNRSQGGLGLGLALVKGLIELHGGTVEAQSGGPGTGARFTIRIPVADRAADTGDGAVRRAERLERAPGA